MTTSRSKLKSGTGDIFKRCTLKPYYRRLRTRSPENEIVSEETAARRALLRQQRVKRNKFAMLTAYAGQGYFGFQRNTGVETVEEVLLAALFRAGYINKQMFNESWLIRFQQASRTDKGVSAVGQVVSLKLPVNASVEEINNYLPQEIRVLALVKVTRGFSSRTFSNARTYSYTLPTFAFAHHSVESTDYFRLSTELRQWINVILSFFKGSRSFHNFTSKKAPLDSTAFRTIIRFTIGEPFVVDGVEFVILKIKGRSFMLHQIRKMVGLTIAVVRGHADVHMVNRSMEHTVMNVPMAPSLGLMLEKVHYKRYNNKYGGDGIHTSLHWSKWNKERELFKQTFIFPMIVEAEKNGKACKSTALMSSVPAPLLATDCCH